MKVLLRHYSTIRSLLEKGSYFFYDIDSLESHASIIKSGIPTVFFACKANPLSAILKVLDSVGFNFDVASEGELYQVRSLGIDGGNIIMTGPAKSEKLLLSAINSQINTFVIESKEQLLLLDRLLLQYYRDKKKEYVPNILLRLQIKWDGCNEKSVLGGDAVTQFGMDYDGIGEIIDHVINNDRINFIGFHVFQWSNILSVDKLLNIWQRTIDVCKSFGVDFQVIDVGGGLGIPYKSEDSAIDWDDVNTGIFNLKNKNKLKNFWLELGRYLVGPYGFYCTKVIDCKINYGVRMLILEGGINHIVRPAIVNEFFPLNLLRESDCKLVSFSIYGPLCTSIDFLGNHLLPEDVKVGDIVVFGCTGAYGFTESMPFFLCHNIAGEAVIEGDIVSVIREPMSAKSWMK